MDKLIRQLRKGNATLSFCYEAGSCGYGLHRRLTGLGYTLLRWVQRTDSSRFLFFLDMIYQHRAITLPSPSKKPAI
ncbi:hypothetical protein ACMHYJ_01905 [Castellaniella hirudinis]|uniref:hypothetical protein n=1 Tax=Castellaniella hirudinis TaxID=1144617 RepID=UPI0039C2B164